MLKESESAVVEDFYTAKDVDTTKMIEMAERKTEQSLKAFEAFERTVAISPIKRLLGSLISTVSRK